MVTYRMIIPSRSVMLAANVRKAETLKDRMIGLLGRNALPEDEGLWIVPCKSVHTIGMKFPIDVIFIDKSLSVVRVVHALSPGRMTRIFLTAKSVLELAAGVARRHDISLGDRLQAIPLSG